MNVKMLPALQIENQGFAFGDSWRPPCFCLWASLVQNLPAVGLIPGSRRSPEEGNGSQLQYSCLESSMDRGTWRV